MVEIKEGERKKEKRMKRNEDNLRDLWDNVKCPSIWIMSPRRRRQKERPWKNTWEGNIENVPKIGKEIATQVQETQRVPNRINPRWNTPKTHINQINEDQHKKTNIKSSKGKTANNTWGDSHKDNSWSFNRNFSGQKGMARHT